MDMGSKVQVTGGQYWTYNNYGNHIGSGKIYGTNTNPSTMTESQRLSTDNYTFFCNLIRQNTGRYVTVDDTLTLNREDRGRRRERRRKHRVLKVLKNNYVKYPEWKMFSMCFPRRDKYAFDEPVPKQVNVGILKQDTHDPAPKQVNVVGILKKNTIVAQERLVRSRSH